LKLDEINTEFKHVLNIIHSNLFLETIEYKGIRLNQIQTQSLELNFSKHKHLRKVILERLNRYTDIIWPSEVNKMEEVKLKVEKLCVENKFMLSTLELVHS